MNGTWQVQALLFAIAVFFALMLLIGWKTRLATVVSWFLLVSLHNSNPLLLQGGDVLLRVGLFWAMFLPWGKEYSVDRSLSFQEVSTGKTVVSVWTAAFLLQIGFFYLFASFFKGYGEPWLSGMSVYYALSMDQFTTPLGEFLRGFPVLLAFLSFSVLWLQKVSFLLFFSPFFTRTTRTLGIILLMCMHLGLAVTMNLGPFSFVSISILTAFLHPDIWDTFMKQLRTTKRLGLKIYYDAECGFCKKSVFFIKTFSLIPETSILLAQKYPEVYTDMRKHDSWVVENFVGERYFGFDAAICIAEHSPLLRFFVPLMKLKWVRLHGEKTYRFVSNHRQRGCELEMPMIEPRLSFLNKKVSAVLGVFLIGYVFLWNLASLPDKRFEHLIPSEIAWVGPLLTLNQKWSMFAPIPSTDDGWYILVGRLKNGTEIDIFQKGEKVSFEKPSNVSAMYSNERWRKYHMNLSDDRNARFRPYYASYLCRNWNGTHTAEERVEHITVVFMLERTKPNFAISLPEKKILYEQNCVVPLPTQPRTPSEYSC
ncbi:MAG: HTTM domain-containing protein [Candidatus Moranbacteria bacterium]|nr:HTTM domain-containing protein [Candidatus Moranbacteria bacterium]